MEEFKLKREMLRAAFTKCANEIETELAKSDVKFENLEIFKRQLEDKFSRLNEIQESISSLLMESKKHKKDFETDFTAAEEYRDKYFSVQSRISQYESRLKDCKTEVPNRKFKLPKLELKRFSGEAKDYLAFWSQFSKIHLDDSIVPEDKYQYLLQAVVPESRAGRLVQSFPATAENYPKAISQLQERFGREDLLVQIYVRDLLSMVMKNAESGKAKTDLAALYDELETKLRALESLGRTKEKYADFLTPLVESCLPESVLREWERTRSSSGNERTLESLMSFVQKEVQSEEIITLAKAGFSDQKREYKSKRVDAQSGPQVATTAALTNTGSNTLDFPGKRNFNCVFCDRGGHPSTECFTGQNLSLEEKKIILIKKGACFLCLRLGHTTRKCKVKVKCLICDKRHFGIMCPDRERTGNLNLKGELSNNNCIKSKSLTNSTKENTYLPTFVINIRFRKTVRKIRALLDTGSQKSYINKRIVSALKLKPKYKQNVSHCVFGGRETEPQLHDVYDIEISDLNSTYKRVIEVLSTDKICGSVPRIEDLMIIKELKREDIELSDLCSHDSEIDLLIGSDFAGHFLTSECKELNSKLTAVRTKLGWTVFGKGIIEDCKHDSVISAISLYVNNATLTDLWNLECIGITDPTDTVSKERDLVVMSDFQKKLKILPEGRYEVELPFKVDAPELSSNQNLTLERHKKMCKKALSGEYLVEYKNVFNEWENTGVIESVPDEELHKCAHYLPHRAVIKSSSETTKIRPVFDASAREKGRPSLNDCLIKGPNLIELIPDIIDRSRLFPIGLSADIEKAFLQIGIAKHHRDFLRFFYPTEEEELVYRHCRVVFGVSSSPFLLSAVIGHLLDNAPIEMAEVARKLKHSFYVDNCITGVSDLHEMKDFIIKAERIMARASFNLRGWESNVKSNYISKATGESYLLGMIWNLDKDTLKCNIELAENCRDTKLSKRNVLSIVQRVFDPLGILSPSTLIPKLKLQEMWKMKVGWDDPLPRDFEKALIKWINELPCLKGIEIPRYTHANKNSELHVFVDASKNAYAACVFIRTLTTSGVKVMLLRSKARVAPLKDLSIPRLELMACVIGARLDHSIRRALDLPEIKTTFWTDSMVALYWIKQKGEWSLFVANRVKEIRQITSQHAWRHIPGSMNPADLLSRGCPPKQLMESKWWKGPVWLLEDPEQWPEDEVVVRNSETDRERRKVTLNNLNIEEKPPWYAERFSDYTSILRMVTWILRFINNSRKSKNLRETGRLSVIEIENAENVLIRNIQSKYFSDSNSLPKLNTFEGNDGILRIRTRITERNDDPDFRAPILLPSDCLFTRRLVEYVHRKNCHAGTHILLSLIREKFWIIGARRAVKNVVKNCIQCKRYNAKPVISEPVSLPKDRIEDAKIFEVVGVDLAGPLFLKKGEKAWIVLYTCAVYRAVHLDLVSALSTDAFLLSLRRFIARRGRPRTIYSDNGTNFRGTNRELSDLDWTKIMKESEIQRIKWKFNPPTAAWWGGWWERLVRVIKELLKRTIGKAVLTYEELMTVLCDCEAVINSRPLTYISEDAQDLIPITPAMFLAENYVTDVSDIDLCEAAKFQKRIRYRMKLMKDLKMRFRKEYLSQLVQKRQSSKFVELKVGDIVLLGDDSKKRLHWPLAVIIKLLPGKDGKIRTVQLRTKSGVLIRPVQRIFPLEIDSFQKTPGVTPDTFELPGGVADAPVLYGNISDSSEPPADVPKVDEKPESSLVSPTRPKVDIPATSDLPQAALAPALESDELVKKVTRCGRVVRAPKTLDLFNNQLCVFESFCLDSKRGEDVGKH